MRAIARTEEQQEKPTDIFEQERKRYAFYNFLRLRRKPTRGALKEVTFPPIKEKEDVVSYFERCHEAVGARPAPIGPMKRFAPNKACPCGRINIETGKAYKYKKCCGRGA
jgi:hypothetical protein